MPRALNSVGQEGASALWDEFNEHPSIGPGLGFMSKRKDVG